jgi:hypothetical protein
METDLSQETEHLVVSQTYVITPDTTSLHSRRRRARCAFRWKPLPRGQRRQTSSLCWRRTRDSSTLSLVRGKRQGSGS